MSANEKNVKKPHTASPARECQFGFGASAFFSPLPGAGEVSTKKSSQKSIEVCVGCSHETVSQPVSRARNHDQVVFFILDLGFGCVAVVSRENMRITAIWVINYIGTTRNIFGWKFIWKTILSTLRHNQPANLALSKFLEAIKSLLPFAGCRFSHRTHNLCETL